MRRTLLGIAVLTGFVFMGCSLLDSAEETMNVAKVKFSAADALVTNPQVTTSYDPYSFRLPSKNDFNLQLTFNFVGDNTGNSGVASFGQTVRPSLNVYIDNQTTPISTDVDPFTIPANTKQKVTLTGKIPFSSINTDILKKIVNQTPIPYRITAGLTFVLQVGGSSYDGPKCEIDLSQGSIPTDVSSVGSYLSKLSL